MSSDFPRVLHVTAMYPSAARPAFGSFVKAQVEGLASLGVPQDVLIVTPDLSRIGYLRAISAIRRRVSRGDVDVVHAHYGLTGAVAAFQSLPLVVTFAGSDLNAVRTRSMKHRVSGVMIRLASQWVAPRAARVIVMNDRMRARLWSRRVQRECLVLPYGVKLSCFVPGDRNAARDRFNLRHDAVIVLWPHGNTPNKRRDLAEAAVRLARTRLPSVQLWRPPHVPSELMPLCYQAADCILVTSDSEGSPTVVKEALGAAVPVISVDVGDVWEHIASIPWCHPVARDVQAIACAIVRAGEDRGPRERPHVVDQFDVRTVARRLIEVYREAMRR